jgi:hypothetical protein
MLPTSGVGRTVLWVLADAGDFVQEKFAIFATSALSA